MSKKEPIGHWTASTKAAEIIIASRIMGQKTPPEKLLEEARSLIGHGFSVTFERGPCIDTHLHIRFEKTVNVVEGKVEGLVPSITLSWSSTHRDPLSVLACVALYEEVAKAAALIQIVLERENIIDKEA